MANLQSSLGNRALAQMLSERDPASLPPAALPALQGAAGNRAVQRLVARGTPAVPVRPITAAPSVAIQRLSEGEVSSSPEMTEADLITFHEWLAEKGEIEQQHIEGLVQSEMSKKGGEHPGVEVVKGAASKNKAKMLDRIPTIARLKSILATYKERKAGTSRGAPVESKEQILEVIKASGLATKMTVGGFKELNVLEWKAYQKKFREKDSKLESVEGVSGFTRDENVYIVQGSQTMFTALHEALHALSSEALQVKLNRPFNEGTTEWLTRTATREKFGKEEDKYRAYDIEVSAVKNIADTAGISQEQLADAYFTGELEPVTSRLIDKYGPESIKDIFESKDLNATMSDLVNAAQRKKKKEPEKLTLEQEIQPYVDGLLEKDFSIEELEKELGESRPELLSPIKSRWQKLQSSNPGTSSKTVEPK